MISPLQQALAAALVQARQTGQALRASDWRDAVTSPAQADAVQQRVTELLGWSAQQVPQAWKSGGPTRQGPFSHAPVTPDGLQHRPATTLLGIEAEVALRLGLDVDAGLAATLQPGALPQGLIDATAPAMELIGSRWSEGLAAPELLRRADHQSNAGLLIGPWRPFEPRNWAQQSFSVQVGQAQPIHYQGGHALGDPSWLLPDWLQQLTQHGQRVPAGTIVTTGAWCGCVPLGSAESAVVEFEALGRVCLDKQAL
ncbi:MAG: 2-keto-4-pentenoate hydratase [Methylibium sp.]|nr:2-keto-4-pentenoate hydratase [Methylibium sp.]